MEQSYYRIGEVSRATGLSKDTLHFYDKIGLLCPEHVDPRNGYRYYSLRNLWQLDIIAACRKLNIPLDTVRQILSLQDNAQIVDLLMEYRQEALRRSAYYQQVASDILWYQEEHRRIEAQKDRPPVVRQVWREAEQVIAGRAAQGSQAYHVNMQQAAQAELRQVVLLVPLAWVFHFAGLTYVWLTFPVTEVLSVLCALVFYRRTPFLSKRRNAE